jgi:hypothetical protein
LPAHFRPVNEWQADIENDRCGVQGAGSPQGLLAIGCYMDAKPFSRKVETEQICDRLLIFHNQNDTAS